MAVLPILVGCATGANPDYSPYVAKIIKDGKVVGYIRANGKIIEDGKVVGRLR